MKNFKLWLEFEEVELPENWDRENDCANIHVVMKDGRHYGINVWTTQFARNHDSSEVKPDLIVKELTRECIENTISELVKKGDLEEVLNPSIFGLKFIEPWWDLIDAEIEPEYFENELEKDVHKNHPLWGKSFKAIAKRQDNDDVLFELEDGRIAVVHLTWKSAKESNNFPTTTIYLNKKDFWKKHLQHDIAEFVE